MEVSKGDSKSNSGFTVPLSTAKKITGWYITAAVVFVVLEMFVIVERSVAGLGVTLLVGWLLISGGITHLLAAFKVGGARRVIFQVLVGIVLDRRTLFPDASSSWQ